jgi:hypothetical protein
MWTAILYFLLRGTKVYGVCHSLVGRVLARLWKFCRRSPRRHYRCVASRPVAITSQADAAAAGWSGVTSLDNGATGATEVGQIVPDEIVEVFGFQSAGSTGRLRAQVERGWVDLVSARGVPLLVDVMTLPQERCCIAVLPDDSGVVSGLLRKAQGAVLSVRRPPSRRSSPSICIAPEDGRDGELQHTTVEEVLATRASFGQVEPWWFSGTLCVRAIPATADRPLENARSVSGCVVVIDRGGVPFVTKARHAQAAGAVGVILVNDTDEPLTAHGHRNLDGTIDGGADVSIPVVCVRKSGGEVLVPRLPALIEMWELDGKGMRDRVVGGY